MNGAGPSIWKACSLGHRLLSNDRCSRYTLSGARNSGAGERRLSHDELRGFRTRLPSPDLLTITVELHGGEVILGCTRLRHVSSVASEYNRAVLPRHDSTHRAITVEAVLSPSEGSNGTAFDSQVKKTVPLVSTANCPWKKKSRVERVTVEHFHSRFSMMGMVMESSKKNETFI